MKTLSVVEVQELFSRIDSLEEKVTVLENRLEVMSALGSGKPCDNRVELSGVQGKIVTMIRGGPRTQDEIARDLGISLKEASHEVACLEHLGVVCMVQSRAGRVVNLRKRKGGI